jgi:hypothetical protein
MFSYSFPTKAAVEWLIYSYLVLGRFRISALAEKTAILAAVTPGFLQPAPKKKLVENCGIGYDQFLPRLPFDAT